MSTNPFKDYQEQFFKMWNENMEKMMDSDAYKAMAKNIPGAESYMKVMESMVPNVEKYWKDMAAAMTASNPAMDYWKSMAEKMPGMDMWKNFADKMPGMDMWKNFTDKMPGMDMWKNIPGMDYWKSFAEKMPGMDFWKSMTDNMPDMGEYWKSFQNMMPNMQEYWTKFMNMFSGMNNYWESFAKMMPNPEKFAALAPYKFPGFEGFAKVFDLWKTYGDPTAMAKDFQEKYMNVTADVIKSLLPEAMQPFMTRPMDFMNICVEYYKQFVSPWMQIEPEIMDRIAKGDLDAYIDFFKDYQVKYEETLEKYFTVMGLGLNREANEDYMAAMNTWNKAMISMGELLAVITRTSSDSFKLINEKIADMLAEGKTLTTFRDFYDVWYSVSEDAYEQLLSTEEFAKVFDAFADRYSQYKIAQNKVYERMLAFLPIPTNTDMKSLYKTVYDLRKDVRDLKRALAAKEEKKEAK